MLTSHWLPARTKKLGWGCTLFGVEGNVFGRVFLGCGSEEARQERHKCSEQQGDADRQCQHPPRPCNSHAHFATKHVMRHGNKDCKKKRKKAIFIEVRAARRSRRRGKLRLTAVERKKWKHLASCKVSAAVAPGQTKQMQQPQQLLYFQKYRKIPFTPFPPISHK